MYHIEGLSLLTLVKDLLILGPFLPAESESHNNHNSTLSSSITISLAHDP